MAMLGGDCAAIRVEALGTALLAGRSLVPRAARLTLLGVALLFFCTYARCDDAAVGPRPSAGSASPDPTGARADPARARDGAFNILEYRVVGNTRLARLDIEKAVYPFLGPHRSIKDVEAARLSLERA